LFNKIKMPTKAGKLSSGQMKGVNTPMQKQNNTPALITKPKTLLKDLTVINFERLLFDMLQTAVTNPFLISQQV